jgi:hypothetical protein
MASSASEHEIQQRSRLTGGRGVYQILWHPAVVDVVRELG